jgi:glutamate racemase
VLGQRVARAAAWFSDQGVSELVVACNAASTVLGRVALPEAARGAPALALFGVIAPTLRALLRGPRCSVGVFGGRRTIRSRVYRTPLVAAGFAVQQRIAQPLSALVEAGRISGPAVERQVARILQPMCRSTLLVPACTHYVALLPLFQRIAPEARFLDPAQLLLAELLERWPRQRRRVSDAEFWTTGSPAAFERGAALAFGLALSGTRKLKDLPAARRC